MKHVDLVGVAHKLRQAQSEMKFIQEVIKQKDLQIRQLRKRVAFLVTLMFGIGFVLGLVLRQLVGA